MTDLEDRTKRLERLEKALGLPSQEGSFKVADGAQTAFVRAEPQPVSGRRARSHAAAPAAPGALGAPGAPGQLLTQMTTFFFI